MSRSTVVILIVFCVCGSAGAHPAPPRFVEHPGVLEFSGRMIVRPAQDAECAERGLSGTGALALRARAADRLRPHLVAYVPATDEHVVTVPPDEDENSFAAALMATGDYEYAVPDWRCFPVTTVPDDPDFGGQWHHTKVHSPEAWTLHVGGAGMVIAVVDGGVRLDHPDLAPALVPGYNAADRVAQIDGGDVTDVDGHGTFVAGLAAAVGNNGIGVVGMGWNFSLMPVRYYNSPGGGYLSDVLDGVRWAVDHGARIINVSQTGVEYEPVQTTGAYVAAQGGLLFWAAGNDARDLSWFDWPDVVVVGATDRLNRRPAWSAFGLAVDVFAPGANILGTGIEGGLAEGSGTSAATPIAAGIAGLVWSRVPGLHPGQVEHALRAGCVDLGSPGDDPIWGWGRVDSYASMVWAIEQACPGDVTGDGQTNAADFTVLAGGFGSVVSPNTAGDLTGDGVVNAADFTVLAGDFGCGMQ